MSMVPLANSVAGRRDDERVHPTEVVIRGCGPMAEFPSNREPEVGAHTGPANHADLAPHELDQMLRNGETKSCPPELTGGRCVRLREAFKDVLVQMSGNTHAGVDDLEANRAHILDNLRQGGAHDNRPSLGELDGVPDEIRQDLS